jgi:methyl-accepting chemotaxis protein
MAGNMKVSTYPVLLLIIVMMSGTLLISGYGLYLLKESLLESCKHEIKSILTHARHQSSIYIDQAVQGLISRKTAEKKVVETLSGLRGTGASYVWANDNNAIARVHIRPAVIGQYQKSYLEHMIRLKHHQFVFYVGTNIKPGTENITVKMNGVTKLPYWNWTVGYGIYFDDIDKTYWKFAIQLIYLTLFVLCVMVMVAIYVFRLNLNMLKNIG